MGQQGSKDGGAADPADAALADAEAALGAGQQAALQKCWSDARLVAEAEQPRAAAEAYAALFRLPPSLATAALVALGLGYRELVVGRYALMRGGAEASGAVALRLALALDPAAGYEGEACTCAQLSRLAAAAAGCHLAVLQGGDSASAEPRPELGQLCAAEAFHGLRRCADADATLTAAELGRWLENAHGGCIRQLLDIRGGAGEGAAGSAEPAERLPLGSDSLEGGLLSPADVWMLTRNLPAEHCVEWRCLFASARDGSSFARMVGSSVKKGATVVVIRDRQKGGGHVFGGYAPESWEVKADFFGSSRSFIYKLRSGEEPAMAVFRSTGFSDSFQYLNVDSEFFPNGLCFGGKREPYHFAIALNSDLKDGSCSYSSTFDSPVLAGDSDYVVDSVEVWAVQHDFELSLDDQYAAASKASGANWQDNEDRNLLGLVGKANNSAGLSAVPTKFEDDDDDS